MKPNQYVLTAAILVICALGAIGVRGEPPALPGVAAARQVVVQILPDDAYKVGRTPIRQADLSTALQVLAGLPEKPAILIQAANDTPYARVIAVLDACHGAGLTEVVLAEPSSGERR